MNITVSNKSALFVQPDGRRIDGRDFAAAVAQFAKDIEAYDAVINLCEDRISFAVVLMAGLTNNTVNILPPNSTVETVKDCLAGNGKVAVIAENVGRYAQLELPLLSSPAVSVNDGLDGKIALSNPRLNEEQVVALVYTSGSTGKPVAHSKRWRDLLIENRFACERLFHLVQNAKNGAAREVVTGEAGLTEVGVVATVPAQHMYGLETSVLTALQGNAIVYSGKPFYPADIAEALAKIPSPRILVTTPAHLRVLTKSTVEVPELAQVISATAPLDKALAKAAENRLGCLIKEIYGCTEAGSIASREQLVDESWRLYPEMVLSQTDEGNWMVAGPQLPTPQPLADRLVVAENGTFSLLGRSSDLLNIAGKRASKGDIATKLKQLDGVDDVFVYCPEDLPQGKVARLSIVLEAPTTQSAVARESLLVSGKSVMREYFDPVFQPRKWMLVERLPRNATGKVLAKDIALLVDQGSC